MTKEKYISDKCIDCYEKGFQAGTESANKKWEDKINKLIEVRKGSLGWYVKDYEETFSIHDLKQLLEEN